MYAMKDAERAVAAALGNPERARWSNRKIAEACGLSLNHGTMLVGAVRARLTGSRTNGVVKVGGAAVPKERRPVPDAPAGPAGGAGAGPADVRVAVVHLKGSPGYAAWLDQVHEKTHVAKAALFRLAMAEWAERNGHPRPPEI